MRNKGNIFAIALVIVWFIFACSNIPTAEINSIETPTISTTPSVLVETPISFTVTPSQTPTTLVIPSATVATIAVIPTLNNDQAYSFIQRTTKGNPECLLPCWAGIRPGESTNTEAISLTQSLSNLIYGGPFYPYKGKELSGGVGGRDLLFGDTKIRFRFNWATERGKETIELLGVSADALTKNSEWTYGSKPYNQLFENYNLHNIISHYGVPSQVWTIAEVYYFGNDKPNPNLPEEFNLLLFYDKGILIHYNMPLKRLKGAKGKACPSEAFFDMTLVSAATSQFYQRMMFPSDANLQDSSPYKPVEESTQMSFDEFYQAFKESNTPCFEIPLTIWPQH